MKMNDLKSQVDISKHPFVSIAREVFKKTYGFQEEPLDEFTEDTITWRMKGGGICILVTIYQRDGDFFCIFDGVLGYVNPNCRNGIIEWALSYNDALPFTLRLALREGNKITAQFWTCTDFITEEGFRFRLETFGKFCTTVFEELEIEFGIEAFSGSKRVVN